MITIIFGAPGVGKTAFMACLLKELYRRQGERLLEYCRTEIEEENRTRSRELTLPDQPPIFSDFKVSFLDGYEKEYTPFFINGYYFGLENEKLPTQYVPPGSKIFLSEAQRYFDSRKSSSFPEHVSRAVEMHRHFGIDLYMDVQRAGLIDLNVRALCRRFVEIVRAEHEKTATGRIVRSTFFLREFDNLISVERYIAEGTATFRETTYTHRGNIFCSFDSVYHKHDFVPQDGKDYRFLPFLQPGEQIPEAWKMFYDVAEPKGYRGA